MFFFVCRGPGLEEKESYHFRLQADQDRYPGYTPLITYCVMASADTVAGTAFLACLLQVAHCQLVVDVATTIFLYGILQRPSLVHYFLLKNGCVVITDRPIHNFLLQFTAQS